METNFPPAASPPPHFETKKYAEVKKDPETGAKKTEEHTFTHVVGNATPPRAFIKEGARRILDVSPKENNFENEITGSLSKIGNTKSVSNAFHRGIDAMNFARDQKMQ